MEMSPPHLAGQKREPQDRLAGVSPQSVYMAGKCGQGMVKICREAVYLTGQWVYARLNRLVTADGAWGSGAFRYDVHGDIVQKALGSSVTDYVYTGLRLA